MTIWSLADLSERAGRMARLLGVHPGPDITVAAAASLAALPRQEAHLALLELSDEHLVTNPGPGRYGYHDLLRSHAAEIARTEGGDTERRAAVHRMLDHYLHTARTASGPLDPFVTRLAADPPQPGVQPEEISHSGEAEQWFASERHVLFAMIDQAAEQGYRPHAWALPWVVGSFFRDKASRQRLVSAQMSALRVAAEHGDPAGRALASLHLGQLRFWLGEDADACRHLEDAAELYRSLGDQEGADAAFNTLSRQLAQLGTIP